MCFSATADTAAGLLVTAIGADALRRTHRPADRALGSVPVVLGAHLLVEAVVWHGLTGTVAASTGRLAMWIYLAIAVVVLPVLLPLAVRAVEPDPGRRRAMARLGAAGAGLAAVYLFGLVDGPVDVRIEGRHLAYQLGMSHGGVLAAVYAVVTCAPLLLSSERRIVAFGLANLLAVGLLTWLQSSALTSLWCAWAAGTSVAIATHLRRQQTGPEVRMHAA